jgi:hypothetical protein
MACELVPIYGDIRSDSEYGLATASFIGYGHLEPLYIPEKSNLIKNAA